MSSDGHPAPRPTNDNRPPSTATSFGDELVMGLRFYSRLPTGNAPHRRPNLDRMALTLPLTSVVMGIPPVITLLLLGWMGVPTFFAATVSVMVLVVVGGGMVEDALADATDGLFGGPTIEERLAIMKDSRHGTYGVCAIVALLAARITAVGSIISPLEAAAVLLTAPIIARSGALWLSLALPPARSGGAAATAGQVSRQKFLLGIGVAAVVSFATAGFAVGFLGLAAAFALAALVAWGWTTLCRRLIGGQTGDLIGALGGLLEIAALTAFMIFV
ncbi:MAG TPA: adenosylcobinamide-GDP ribazoletransferase [Devosia sp.]|nr:adenosylcobinamide-GDP ribazoletransferase [Devosia sp.]